MSQTQGKFRQRRQDYTHVPLLDDLVDKERNEVQQTPTKLKKTSAKPYEDDPSDRITRSRSRLFYPKSPKSIPPSSCYTTCATSFSGRFGDFTEVTSSSNLFTLSEAGTVVQFNLKGLRNIPSCSTNKAICNRSLCLRNKSQKKNKDSPRTKYTVHSDPRNKERSVDSFGDSSEVTSEWSLNDKNYTFEHTEDGTFTSAILDLSDLTTAPKKTSECESQTMLSLLNLEQLLNVSEAVSCHQLKATKDVLTQTCEFILGENFGHTYCYKELCVPKDTQTFVEGRDVSIMETPKVDHKSVQKSENIVVREKQQKNKSTQKWCPLTSSRLCR